MIERAGYPGIAADLDAEKIASVFPAMKKQALEMWEEGRRLTGHPGLPLEPTRTSPLPPSKADNTRRGVLASAPVPGLQKKAGH